MKKIIAFILVFIYLFSPAWATTVTFQNGVNSYTSGIDARIISGSTNEEDTTAGGGQFNTGGNTWVVYFNISSIPSGASVTSATVNIHVAERNCTGGVTASVTKILNPDNSGGWTTWPSAQDNFNQHATWAFKDHGGSTKWSVSGSNGDFTDVNTGSAESTTSIPACAAQAGYDFSVTNMVGAWVANPNSNAGMFFVTNSSAVTVLNQFDGTASNHALLTVTYTVPTTISGGTFRGATIK